MSLCIVCKANPAADDIRYSGMCADCYQADCEAGIAQADEMNTNLRLYGTIDAPALVHSLEDILVWSCGTWCYREELNQMSHMSDDYQVLWFDTPAYISFMQVNGLID